MLLTSAPPRENAVHRDPAHRWNIAFGVLGLCSLGVPALLLGAGPIGAATTGMLLVAVTLIGLIGLTLAGCRMLATTPPTHWTRCPTCDYSLLNLATPRCPECGRTIPAALWTTLQQHAANTPPAEGTSP